MMSSMMSQMEIQFVCRRPQLLRREVCVTLHHLCGLPRTEPLQFAIAVPAITCHVVLVIADWHVLRDAVSHTMRAQPRVTIAGYDGSEPFLSQAAHLSTQRLAVSGLFVLTSDAA